MSATIDGSNAATEHLVTLREVDRSNARVLAAELHRLLDGDVTLSEAFRLDCGAIEFIDSHGVAVLIRFGARLRSLGRRLVLTDTSPPVRRTLEALGLGDRFGLA